MPKKRPLRAGKMRRNLWWGRAVKDLQIPFAGRGWHHAGTGVITHRAGSTVEDCPPDSASASQVALRADLPNGPGVRAGDADLAINSSPPPTFRKRYPTGSPRIPFWLKLREMSALFAMCANEALQGESFDWLFEEIFEYGELLRKYGGVPIERARVLEIGSGQRADRLTILNSLGIDAIGVDLDAPVFHGSAAELFNVLRVNGVERFLRSFVRYCLFDSLHFRRLNAALTERGVRWTMDPARMITGDVLDLQVAPGSLDLVIAEDVFEHVRPATLRRIVERMSIWLKPDGLALIRPDIFTGIQGGHLSDWFTLEKDRRRMSEPWEHLRKKRFPAQVYLNELTRQGYREMFGGAFDIIEERVKRPNLGREYLTDTVAGDLAGYSDDELFSNRVLFVLRPRAKARSHHAPADTPLRV